MTRKSGLLILALALAVGVSEAGADAVGDSNICYAQFATGDYRSAIDYCTRAIDSGALPEEDLVTSLLNRGVAFKSVGEYDRAIADYTRALALAPDDALLYQNRANALREKGDLAPALGDIEKAIELNPDSAGAWYVRGALAEALGNRDVARRYYMTALGLDPQNAVYRSKAFGQEAQ
ncbi:MAG TPA: hypothetical protein DCF73_00555 [Rhodobiaceae bacterium]|nr:hypothetical protein [Rhodobiaceae bacterium]